jgi:hypothetical protein
VVLALGFIERLRWDRWALQQIHRVLREGGTLLLTAPDLYSLRSLADPRYVATKLAKVLPRLGRGRSGMPPAGAATETVRTYAARRPRGDPVRPGTTRPLVGNRNGGRAGSSQRRRLAADPPPGLGPDANGGAGPACCRGRSRGRHAAVRDG